MLSGPRVWAVAALVVGLVSSVFATGANAVIIPTRVLVYGDSLMWESEGPLAVSLPSVHWAVTDRAVPTTAPCDWIPELASDLASVKPAVVVVETIGNSFTPCMDDPSTGVPYVVGSAGYFAKYKTDVSSMFSTIAASGAKLVVVNPPPVEDPTTNATVTQIVALLKTDAASVGGKDTNVPRAAVSTSNKFVMSKKCLASETAAMGCANDQILIRAPDGEHFCPTGADFYGCPVYSSGAWRFGRAIASMVKNTAR